MNTYYDIKDMLHDKLGSIVKKGELSAGSLDTVDKLLNSIKNSCKIIMYEEYSDDGYSYTDADREMHNYSYARGRDARRDSRGRYSRRGYSYADEGKEKKMELLHELKADAHTEDEKRIIDKIIRRMERE